MDSEDLNPASWTSCENYPPSNTRTVKALVMNNGALEIVTAWFSAGTWFTEVASSPESVFQSKVMDPAPRWWRDLRDDDLIAALQGANINETLREIDKADRRERREGNLTRMEAMVRRVIKEELEAMAKLIWVDGPPGCKAPQEPVDAQDRPDPPNHCGTGWTHADSPPDDCRTVRIAIYPNVRAPGHMPKGWWSPEDKKWWNGDTCRFVEGGTVVWWREMQDKELMAYAANEESEQADASKEPDPNKFNEAYDKKTEYNTALTGELLVYVGDRLDEEGCARDTLKSVDELREALIAFLRANPLMGNRGWLRVRPELGPQPPKADFSDIISRARMTLDLHGDGSVTTYDLRDTIRRLIFALESVT